MTASVTGVGLNGTATALAADAGLEQLWSPWAPRKLRKAYQARGTAGGWLAWADHLAKRRQPSPLAALLPGRRAPLAWVLPHGLTDTPTAQLVQRLWKLERSTARHKDNVVPIADALTAWLTDAETASADAAYALEALAWCRALPKLTALVAEPLWWQLWHHLTAVAGQAAHSGASADPWTAQMLSAELPLCLAHQFPELTTCDELAPAGCRAAERGLQAFVLDEGLLHARHWGLLRPLLASWTRTWTVARDFHEAAEGAPPFEVPPKFAQFLATVWRLCRPDGSQMLASADTPGADQHLFEAAGKLAADPAIDAAARLVLSKGKLRSKPAARRRCPAPAAHAEAAEACVLRSGWDRSDIRLACTYADNQVRLELGAGRETLLGGRWEFRIRADGRPVQTDSCWEEVCWYSDDEVQYLEVEVQLTAGLRLQRQVLLAREDRFLLLADATLAKEPTAIEYTGVLQLPDHVAFDAPLDTCEAFLTVGKPRALVLPLALPEWRSASRNGSLARTEAGLELRQSAHGRSLFAPLFFDLDRRRSKKPFTWRQLTVAEALQALPNDAAVGYRVAVGDEQWLFYRSLVAGGVRSVLGQQLAREFMLARFRRSGDAERLLEIELE